MSNEVNIKYRSSSKSAFNIVKAISQLYRNYNKYYRKRLTLFWNKINNTFPNKIIKYKS